jgi:hypothetical protein
MKKQTTIIQSNNQTRVTVPRIFVKNFKITKKDKIQWEQRGDSLNGKLIKK